MVDVGSRVGDGCVAHEAGNAMELRRVREQLPVARSFRMAHRSARVISGRAGVAIAHTDQAAQVVGEGEVLVESETAG
jgi:hypothetical protein